MSDRPQNYVEKLENQASIEEVEVKKTPEQKVNEFKSSDEYDPILAEDKNALKMQSEVFSANIETQKMMESLNSLNKTNLKIERPKLKNQLDKNPSLRNSVLKSIEDNYSKLENNENKIILTQIYGQIEIDKSISVDGIDWVQTLAIKSFLEAKYSRDPNIITQSFANINQLKSKNKALCEKITTNLLRIIKVQLRPSDQQMWLKFSEDNLLNIYAIQLIWYFRPDEYAGSQNILIDGIMGKQTKSIQNIIYQLLPDLANSKKWKKDDKDEKKMKKDERNPKNFADKNSADDPEPKSIKDTSVRDIRWNTSLRSFLQENKTEVKNRNKIQAIDTVINEIKDRLDTTTRELINFWEALSRNPQNSDDFFIDDDQIIIKWKLQWNPIVPIVFRYDMNTGVVKTNDTLYQQDNTFLTSGVVANQSIFSLPTFEELQKGKKKDAKREKLKHETIDPAFPFEKQLVELNIERNRAAQTLFETFDINTQKLYTADISSGVYHLLQILNNSLTTAEDARIFRKNIQDLNKMLGKQEIHTDLSHSTKKWDNHSHEESNLYYNKNADDIHPVLRQFFSQEKRINDKKLLWTKGDENNGIYQFLKGFTTNIDINGTYFSDNQKLNIAQFQTYLSKLQSEDFQRKQIIKNDNFTHKEQSTAGNRLIENRPPDVM